MKYNYDMATHAELKRALQREPSGFQIQQLPTANVALSPSTPEQTVFLFPYDPTSKFRKLEIVGNQRHFTYKIKAMQRPATDQVWSAIYSDIGGALFEETQLAAAWDNVKVTMEEWVNRANVKRDSRIAVTGASSQEPRSSSPAAAEPAASGTTSAGQVMVSDRQQAILQSIIQERDAKIAERAKQPG